MCLPSELIPQAEHKMELQQPGQGWGPGGAGLTVSTLPAVRSMELALMASSVMSACRSSSATTPL